MKRIIFSLIIIGTISLIGLRAFFATGFYTSHDGEKHAARIANYYSALNDGQFPPRWAGKLDGGMGSPIFVYIYPLPYLLGSIFHQIGMSFVDSYKLVMGGSYLLSGIFFYIWLKRRFGNLASIVGAILYVWAPYRFLMLFVRGAYAESAAYMFVPLVFLASDKILERRTMKWVGIGSLFVAGLMLMHNLVAFIFLPVAVIYSAISLFRNRINFRDSINLLISYTLGFLISSFVYIPDLLEKNLTHFDKYINYSQEHFVYFWQLIRSPWNYGFSFAGPNDGMSFQLGVSQIGIFLSCVFFCILSLPKIISFIKQKGVNKISDKTFYFLSFSTTFVISILLLVESGVTRYIWTNLPGLSTIDYPWRILGLSVFSISVLSVILINRISNGLFKIIVALFFIFLALVGNRNHLRVNEPYNLSDKSLLAFDNSGTHLGEFTPITRLTTDFISIKVPVEVINGNASIVSTEWATNKQRYVINVTDKAKIRINTLYFPGWKVFQNGKELTYNKDFFANGNIDLKTNVDHSGLFVLDLLDGTHEISLKYTETLIRLTGDILSLIGLVGVGLLFLLDMKQKILK